MLSLCYSLRMSHDRTSPLNDVGKHLVEASRTLERTPRGMLSELFPYVMEASRRMSTRAISTWLKDVHGIQISQPTISRAVRNPERYWRAFAEFIEPRARQVEQYLDVPLEEFLFNEALFDRALDEEPKLSAADGAEALARLDELQEAVSFLREAWFGVSDEARSECRRFLQDEPESERKP